MSVDTLTLAPRLRAAELPASHAEAIAAAIGAAMLEGAATKEDLSAVKAELKADIAATRADIQVSAERLLAKIEGTKNQLLVWPMGAIFAAAGLVIAVARL